MNLLLSALLLVMVGTTVVGATFEEDGHGALRHRQLRCIKKGDPCPAIDMDCCGKSTCDGPTCCLPNGVKGCDTSSDCCGGIACVDSLCGEGDDPDAGGRQCGIHGEDCIVTGSESSDNDCCGSMKYLCEVVVDSPTVKCCMALGGKGCSSNAHCCGSLDGNRCEESRCVDADGYYPDDSPGGRNCGLKGETCADASDCCGNSKYDCAMVGTATEETCCILTGLNGCEYNAHCCSNNCDTAVSLCVV